MSSSEPERANLARQSSAFFEPGLAKSLGARMNPSNSGIGAWSKRRWFDLRNGYGLYISIFLGFVNFCLLISVKFPSLNPYLFVPLIGAAAAASATTIGYLHRKKQMRTDNDSVYEQSRLMARVNEIQLKAILGKATDEEVEWALDLLEAIRNNRT